jgi:hypothetical protein
MTDAVEPSFQARIDVSDGRKYLGGYARSARVGGFLAVDSGGRRIVGEFKTRAEAVKAIVDRAKGLNVN